MYSPKVEVSCYSNLVTIEEIKAIVEPIARKYGVERVYLFGSSYVGELQ